MIFALTFSQVVDNFQQLHSGVVCHTPVFSRNSITPRLCTPFIWTWCVPAEEAVTASSSMLTPNGFRAVSPEAPATPANSSETFPQHSTSAASPSYTTTDACLASQAGPAVQATAVDNANSTSPTSTSSASHEPVQSADQSADESSQSLDRRDGSDPGVLVSLYNHAELDTEVVHSHGLASYMHRDRLHSA